MDLTTRRTAVATLIGLALPLPVLAASPIHVTLYKNPQCDCCEGYADYLRKNGFDVEVKPTNDLAEISRKAGVPEDIRGLPHRFHRWLRGRRPCAGGDDPQASVGAARHRRHHLARHASRFARHGRHEEWAFHHLRGHQGRQGTHRLCERVIMGTRLMRGLNIALFGAAFAAASSVIAADPPQNFIIQEPRQPVPEVQFKDAEGRSHSSRRIPRQGGARQCVGHLVHPVPQGDADAGSATGCTWRT